MRPYIGITDFMCYRDVESMQKVFESHKPKDFLYQLHVGVMMSYKTLNHIPTKWSNAFPRATHISDIFSRAFRDDVFYCLHYADSEKRDDLWKSLRSAINYGGQHMHALQLDLVWPDRFAIYAAITETWSQDNLQIILQIGKQAFEEIGNNPNKLVKRLYKYAYDNTLHRVLLDKSMGRGIGMDAKFLLPFIDAIKKDLPDIGIGVAGGLGPDTFNLAEPIISLYNNISVDAQGQLRPNGSALKPVDWNMAGRYLESMIKMIEKYHFN